MSSAHIGKRKCAECTFYGEETDGEHGEIFCGYTCALKPHLANLRTFPFKNEQPCFVQEFWLSKYSSLVDEHEKSIDAAIAEWRKEWGEKMDALQTHSAGA